MTSIGQSIEAVCAENGLDRNLIIEAMKEAVKAAARKQFKSQDKTGESILISDYIAVYGGVTEDEAAQILDLIKKDFPKAQLKKMVAVYERTEM